MQKKMFFTGSIILLTLLLSAPLALALDSRYTKLDATGAALSSDAQEWAITFDSSTGLYWEVKSQTEDIHSQKGTYSYSEAKKNFIAALNDEKFGGFSDWRLPTIEELTKLKSKGEEAPYINQDAFPNTTPSDYISWELCGNGEISPKKVSFGTEKAKKGSRYVRAVRGASPDGSDRY